MQYLKFLVMLFCFGLATLASAEPIITKQQIDVSTVTTETPATAPVTAAPSALDAKANRERRWREADIPLIPYKPNYFLPYSQSLDGRPGGGLEGDQNLQSIEAEFQFSVRVPVVTGLFWGYGTLQLAYTQLSFYQIYNSHLSAPFRETDYEPEAQLAFETPYRLFGWAFRNVNFAFDHQSNGRSRPDSRSWNRVYAQAIMGRGNASISLRPWLRLKESAPEDDNPDIEHYLGNFELIGAYTWRRQVVSILLRNNLDFSDNKGAVDVSYSFPLNRKLRGYLKYFNGYGETLIDYNRPISRVGLGLSLSDWL